MQNGKKTKLNFEIVSGICFLIISVAYYIAATKLPKSKLFDIGADFMPKIYAVGLGLLSLAFIVLGAVKIKKSVTAEESSGKEKEEYPTEYDRVVKTSVIFIAYVFLMKPVGFIISTFVFLIVEMILFAPDNKKTKKDIILYIVISLISSIGLYYAFRNGFHVLLPKGLLNI